MTDTHPARHEDLAPVYGRISAAPADWEQAARRAGLTDAQVQQVRAELPSAAQVQGASAEAAWWSLLGVALSLAAAVGGAVAGAGPRAESGGVLFRRTTVAVAHG